MKIDTRTENLLQVFFKLIQIPWYRDGRDLQRVHTDLTDEQRHQLDTLFHTLDWARECGPTCPVQFYRDTGMCNKTCGFLGGVFAEWVTDSWHRALKGEQCCAAVDREIRTMANLFRAYLGLEVPRALIDTSLLLGAARAHDTPEEIARLNEQVKIHIERFCGCL